MTPSAPTAHPWSLSSAKRIALIAFPCGRGFCHSQPRPAVCVRTTAQTETAMIAARQNRLIDFCQLLATCVRLRSNAGFTGCLIIVSDGLESESRSSLSHWERVRVRDYERTKQIIFL